MLAYKLPFKVLLKCAICIILLPGVGTFVLLLNFFKMFIFRWVFFILISTNVFAGQQDKDLYGSSNSSVKKKNCNYQDGPRLLRYNRDQVRL